MDLWNTFSHIFNRHDSGLFLSPLDAVIWRSLLLFMTTRDIVYRNAGGIIRFVRKRHEQHWRIIWRLEQFFPSSVSNGIRYVFRRLTYRQQIGACSMSTLCLLDAIRMWEFIKCAVLTFICRTQHCAYVHSMIDECLWIANVFGHCLDN